MAQRQPSAPTSGQPGTLPQTGQPPVAHNESTDGGKGRGSFPYVSVGIGLIVLVLVIIFFVQNLHETEFHFIGMHFKLPVGVLVLASAVAGALIVHLIGLALVARNRLRARREARIQRQATA